MVVGIFKAGLQRVVIDISNRPLGLDARNAHRFKFEIGHGAGGVLRQRLIDLETDFAADGHFAADKMGTNELLCQGICHR